MTEKILISTIKATCGSSVGRITLNKPKALNALDIDMVLAIKAQLEAWRQQVDIGAIFIDSNSEKAFCAGGDVVSMYKAMAVLNAQNVSRVPDFIAQFFEQEYRLDYMIHSYPKPIICWGNGIIMGGGLGVFAGASHKIVTESTYVAMPEITIGLFPDVGASYFLNKMPPGVGKFLGLSGTAINAHDCITIGLADTFLPNTSKQVLLEKFAQLQALNATSVSQLIDDLQNQIAPQKDSVLLSGEISHILPEFIALNKLETIDEVSVFMDSIKRQHPKQKSIQRGVSAFSGGSPITAILVLEQLKRAKKLSLAECFQMELSMAYQCSVGGEFLEGIRALLIDKDNQPNWQYKQSSDVPESVIENHFTYFERCKLSTNKNGENPLALLATEYREPHA
jgi:enoyl-CoA hydratase/carnithine racemase